MAKALALTSGEPAGIGPDIALKAWLRRDELKLPAFYWLGDVASLERRAKALALNIRLAEVRKRGFHRALLQMLGLQLFCFH